VKNDVIVIPSRSERGEVLAGFGSVVVVELERNGTLCESATVEKPGALKAHHCGLENYVDSHLLFVMLAPKKVGD